MAQCEVSAALVRKAAESGDGTLCATSRLCARAAARAVMDRSLVIVSGGADTTGASLAAFAREAGFDRIHAVQVGAIEDMDLVARAMVAAV